jgi:RHS repeat-associated protein
VTNAQYGRGNTVTQFSLFQNAKTSTSRYEYNPSDSRIYKSRTFTVGVNVSEYYIKSSAGLDLGIYDFARDTFVWYLYGAGSERIAKVNHLPATNYGNLAAGGGGSGGGQAARAMGAFQSADFYDEEFIKEKLPENPIFKALQRIQTSDGKVLIPNTLYAILDERGQVIDALLATDPDLKLDQYKYIDTVPLYAVYTPVAIPLDPLVLDPDSRDTIKPVLIITPEEVLQIRTPIEVPVNDKDLYDVPMEPAIMAAGVPEPTIVPQPIFYLNDHLGNTRVTFRADVCDGVPVKYYIDHAIDYYPYGKTLREYYPLQKERYLTTQHERDAETSYDNRGARLYDADVMRFLSVDPLAADYAAWSGYHYVLGNPLMFVDPDGREADDIILKGNAKERQQSLDALGRLSNDKLVASSDGKVRIIGKGTENKHLKLSNGTKMIADLIKDNNVTNISHSVGQSASGTDALLKGVVQDPSEIVLGQEYDSNIGVNFSTAVSTRNLDGTQGGVSRDITLAHELCHAYINSVGQNDKRPILAFDPDSDYNLITTNRTEMRTRSMENDIRAQQNVKQRANMVTPAQLRAAVSH